MYGRLQMFFKIGVTQEIYTGKHLCWSLLFNKVAGLRPAILIKKRLQHKRFLANIGKSFYRVTPVAASKTRQFLLYLCYVLFSKPFKVLFFLRQKYIEKYYHVIKDIRCEMYLC